MTNSCRKLDVFLRGQRDYVQGTQIIARAAETLTSGDWRFERSGFSRITEKLVRISETSVSDQAIGVVGFADSDGKTHELHIVETDILAPVRDLPMPVAAERCADGVDGQTIYDFADVSAFEDMLNVIVIAIKNEHRVRFENCVNVWLTGLRNFKLPVSSKYPKSGTLQM